jgi:DNA-3-methyladenine glycosylase II
LIFIAPQIDNILTMPALAAEFLAQADPVLAQVIDVLPEPVPETTGEVFHDLLSCVFEQQIHYRSTKKTFQKLLDAADLEVLTPENFAELEAKSLGQAKLSASKYETLGHILEFWQTHAPNWQLLGDGEVRQTLASIKGIGPWTIDMILLYTLQRPNVFPADDFHLKQVMISLYGLDPHARLKAQMEEAASAWEGQKSLATRYLLDWKAYTKATTLAS